MMTTTIGLKLDNETRERLQQLGSQKDRSSHWLMKRAIAEYLEREEAFEREKQEDLARWEAYQQTGEAIAQSEMTAVFDELTSKARARQD